MSDLNVHAAERMSREAAMMGHRIAALIDRSVTRDGAFAQGHSFLSAMFATATSGTQSTDAETPARGYIDEDACPLDRLRAAFGLTRTDLDLVVLAGMADEHEGYASILRSLNPRSEPHATAGLAAQLLCENARDRVALRRTLETGVAKGVGLIALTGDAPLFERNLMLGEGLWTALCGIDAYPASIGHIEIDGSASGLDSWLASPEILTAKQAITSAEPRVLLVIGDTETSAAHRAAALVLSCPRRPCVFDLRPSGVTGTERLALVHALARGTTPIFRISGADHAALRPLPDASGFPGVVIVCARRGSVEVSGRVPVMSLDVGPIPPTARASMWRETLPELAAHATTLASRYTIEPYSAAEVTRDLRARQQLNGSSINLAMVADGVRVRSNLPLAAGVTLVRPTARWKQLVLPASQKSLLLEAVRRLTHQSTVLDRWRFLEGRPGARGVRVLLTGPPGVGKSLSAECMAHGLGVDLMVVDISRVVSKWIGETEKHLAQVFDAAERAQAVLLFDEADALFGKRTEVSDAHDRYANLETAYLLSRLERFEGLAVLSTNLKQNIDPAFLRRVEFAIEFDEPGTAERQALWRGHLPRRAPLGDDVNLRELAELYPIVGGLIRNASVAAGFLAAADGRVIRRRHLIGAIRREYEKSAKAFPGAPEGVVPD